MRITEISFTGYSVTNMKRSRAFYEGVLGLQRTRGFGQRDGEDEWLEYDIGAGCLALIAGGGEQWPPHPAGTAAALEVDDFDACVRQLRERGVPIVMEPQESPICWMVVVADPDQNWVVLHHRKPSRGT